MTLPDLFKKDFWIAYKIDSYLMSLQAITGIGFDKEGAEALVGHINKEMDAIAAEVEPQLPPRPLNKGELSYWQLPAKPFTKAGALSSTMLKWCESRGATLVGDTHVEIEGSLYPIVAGSHTKTHGMMRLANTDDLKNWLLELGWKPTMWNVKRDSRGKPERDSKGNLIETTPKMQENGKLCSNLEALSGPLVKQVVRWMSYRNRRSVIEGWLENPRLAYDGRLSASAPLITSTYRQRHSVVVNVPKAQAGVLLGKEMRSLFKAAREGYKFVGYDASALEARVEGHYTSFYEGGVEYAKELIEGDIHLKTAEKMFYPHIGHLVGTPDFHKDNPVVKVWRDKSKTVRYASAYGASAGKLASTLGVTKAEGETIFEAFWEAAKPLSILKDRLTQFWESTGDRAWIRGIDGRKVRTRSKHSLVNTLFQSCGAIVMSYANLLMDKWLGGIVLDTDGTPHYNYKGRKLYRTGHFHDEACWEVPEELAEEVLQMGVRSIIKAGQHLKLKVALDGGGKVGTTWADVH